MHLLRRTRYDPRLIYFNSSIWTKAALSINRFWGPQGIVLLSIKLLVWKPHQICFHSHFCRLLNIYCMLRQFVFPPLSCLSAQCRNFRLVKKLLLWAPVKLVWDSLCLRPATTGLIKLTLRRLCAALRRSCTITTCCILAWLSHGLGDVIVHVHLYVDVCTGLTQLVASLRRLLWTFPMVDAFFTGSAWWKIQFIQTHEFIWV